MSRADALRRYVAERCGGARFVALALVLGAVGTVTSSEWREMTVVVLARSVVVAYLAVLALRIWDDIMDRDADAVRHPGRAVPTADVGALGALLLAIAAALIASGPQAGSRLLLLMVLVLTLAAWYRLRPTGARSALADAHVLMAKYPVIALIAAPGAYDSRELLRAMPVLVVLYLLLCAFEWLDDPRLRRRLSSTVRGPLP
jgi:hypothetical protein